MPSDMPSSTRSTSGFESKNEDQDERIALTPGSFKVLYVYTINTDTHKGRLKVGDATYHTDKRLEDIIAECDSDGDLHTSDEIIAAARKRILQQVGTADVKEDLKAAYLAIKPDKKNPGHYVTFRDYEVHKVLKRSLIHKKFDREEKRSGEWFEVTLDQVKEAVRSVQNGSDSIKAVNNSQITLRPEQQAAVDATLKVFKDGSYRKPKKFLWNAIMRFGKTLTTYALVNELEKIQKMERVLILTHRPVVSTGWAEDFEKSSVAKNGWKFSSRNHNETWDSVKNSQKVFYFASMQDLRGSWGHEETFENASSTVVHGSSDDEFESVIQDTEASEIASEILKKNKEIFDTQWSMIVLDEGHEGTQTSLAQKVQKLLKKKYVLHLSGTPFNIINDFEVDETYSWDYLDERKAFENWEIRKETWRKEPLNSKDPGEYNPYGKLPNLEIRTYDISEVIDKSISFDPNSTKFSFKEFFKVDKTRTENGIKKSTYHPFKNPGHVDKLLNMISYSDEHGRLDEKSGNMTQDHRNFPFSRYNSKENFAHTFWILPSVPAAEALHEMLLVHPNFREFHVVNATGNNDDGRPLQLVQESIAKYKQTITLSVGKLTTGTTVPEWTAVFMLSNMESAMQYMQTIFRVKSSGLLPDGRQKETGYVFDFNPDRSIKLLNEAAQSNARKIPGFEGFSFVEKQEAEREEMTELLKYLPVISYEGARFVEADTSDLMERLKKTFIHQAVRDGFQTEKLFNIDSHGITESQASMLQEIAETIGKSAKDSDLKNITISKSKLTRSDKQKLENKKPKPDSSVEESEEWSEISKRIEEDKDNRRKLLKIMRSISARVPLLVFALGIKENVKLKDFAELVDIESWNEFMPRNFSKELWTQLKDFFNVEVFEGACKELQKKIGGIYELPVLERGASIAHLFESFSDPDKETILTPWRVVNRQYADTLGGLRMVNNDGKWYTRNIGDSSGEVQFKNWEEIEESYGSLSLHPEWIKNKENLEGFWGDSKTTVIDINSKTALYPLYAALSIFAAQKKLLEDNWNPKLPFNSNDENIWKKIVEEQIFVNCRVPYSKRIAERVLAGSTDIRVNASVVDVQKVQKVLEKAKFPELLKEVARKGKIESKDENEIEANKKKIAAAKKAALDAAITDIWKWIFNPESMGASSEDGKRTIADERAEMILHMGLSVK